MENSAYVLLDGHWMRGRYLWSKGRGRLYKCWSAENVSARNVKEICKEMWKECAREVQRMFKECARSKQRFCKVCAMNVQGRCKECSINVQGMCMKCSRNVQLNCVMNVQRRCKESLRNVKGMFREVHGMFNWGVRNARRTAQKCARNLQREPVLKDLQQIKPAIMPKLKTTFTRH